MRTRKFTVPKDVFVKVDPTLKKRWDELCARLDAAMRSEADDFDVLWETADAIVSHEPPLYVFGGYKSDVDFYQQRLKTDARTARRYVRVARHATPADEAKYGTTKLDAALAYIEAKGGRALDGGLPVDFARLRIPVGTGKGARTISFDKATTADVAAATRALVRGKGPAPRSAARAALEGALGEVQSLAGVAVRERAGLLTFAGVPIAALGRFGEVVKSAKVLAPAGASKATKGATKERSARG
jgi:hypothetical protein